MTKFAQLVATTAAIKNVLPEQFAQRYAAELQADPEFLPAGLVSGEFPVDPAKCATKLGRWLAERVSTTRRDDEASRLTVQRRLTVQDLETRALVERLQSARCASESDFQELHAGLSVWLEQQAKAVKVHGAARFRPLVEDFQWPVYGSVRAQGAQTTEQYFDVCARLIRAMQPSAVVHVASGQEPPASLGVTGR